MKKIAMAAVAAFSFSILTPAIPAHAAERHPNGIICINERESDDGVDLDVYMRNTSTGALWRTDLKKGNYNCTDLIHPTWPIAAFTVPSYWKCTSQWGYVYKSGGKLNVWSPTNTYKTVLTLTCKRTYINS